MAGERARRTRWTALEELPFRTGILLLLLLAAVVVAGIAFVVLRAAPWEGRGRDEAAGASPAGAQTPELSPSGPAGASAGSSAGSSAGAPSCTEVSVVAPTSFLPVLDAVAPRLADRSPCVTLDVTTGDGREAQEAVEAEAAAAWIVDDGAWAAVADPEYLGGSSGDLPVLATSPIVAVTDEATAARFPGGMTWSTLAASLRSHEPVRLTVVDPQSSGDGLVAAAAPGQVVWDVEGMDAASGVWARAVEQTRIAAPGAPVVPGAGEIALIPERVLALAPPPSEKVVIAPGDRSAVLRYSWVPTAFGGDDPDVVAARDALLAALTEAAVRPVLAAAGLRPPDGSPLPGSALPTSMGAPLDPLFGHQVQHVLSAYYPEDRKADVLVAVDVSGSMWAVPEGGHRSLISEVKAGVHSVADLLPDDAGLGVWEFGSLLDPPRDHRVVSAPGPLTPEHRSELAASVSRMNARETGTGLYDTILAAYTAARDAHREGIPSGVLVFTDGVNEADPGGVDAAGLSAALAAAQDPTRPVGLTVVVFGAPEHASEVAAAVEPVQGYVSSVDTAGEVADVFAHLAASGGGH